MGDRMQRLLFIDSLRVFSILYIVGLWHLDDYVGDCFYTPLTEIITYGVLNVFVFISSSMIVMKYDSVDSLLEAKRFFYSRVLRVYPIYFLGVMCFVWKGDLPVETTWYALFMVNMLVNDSLGTLWFIGMLFVYYFLLLIILWRFSWDKYVTVGLVVIVSLLTLNYFKIIDVRLLYYLPALFLGVLSGKEHFYSQIIFSKRSIFFASFLFLLIVFIAYLKGLPMGSEVFYVGGFMVVIPIVALFKTINWAPVEKIVMFLSYSSFCMYVFHRIVYYYMLHLFNPVSPWHRLFYLVFLGVPLIILTSCSIQKLYDVFLDKILPKPTCEQSK